jgi:hypothetical protein
MTSGDLEAAVQDNDAVRGQKKENTVEHPSGLNSRRFLKSPGAGEAAAM